MDTEGLIDQVRQLPHLWDKKNPKYMDHLAIENAWATISEILDIEVEDCKARWKNIRDRYIKERRLSMKRPSGSQPCTVKWPFYKLCNFLDSAVKQRRTIGNIKKISESTSSQKWQSMIINEDGHLHEVEEDEDKDSCDNDKNGGDNVEDNSQNESAESVLFEEPEILTQEDDGESNQAIEAKRRKISNSKKERNEMKKRKNTSNSTEIDGLVQNTIKVGDSIQGLVQLMKNDGSTVNEEDHYFGMSVAGSLSKIENPQEKFKVKANILLLLADVGNQ